MSTRSSHVTSYDVARAAQVSIGTVNRVLNNKPNVDEALRARVWEVVKQLGYVHSPKKRGGGETSEQKQASTTLKTVMYCCPNYGEPRKGGYIYRILHGVERECSNHDLQLVYTAVDETTSAVERVRSIVERSTIDGIVAVMSQQSTLLAEFDVPLVAIEPVEIVDDSVDVIMDDDFGGGRLATQHLLELGHREIIYVASQPTTLTIVRQRRIAGYYSALIDAGLQIRPEMIVGKWEPDIRAFLAKRIPFSAAVCFNDEAAVTFMRVLRDAGLRVPEDVSVVGFDDHNEAENAVPPLTTINANTEGKGRAAINRLLNRITDPYSPITWTVVPVHLTQRASTAQAPKTLPFT